MAQLQTPKGKKVTYFRMICIMVRRRQEREQIMQSSDDQNRTNDGRLHEVNSVVSEFI